MEIAKLTANFDVTQYQLAVKSAMLELEGGTIMVQSQYRFHNDAGQRRGPVVLVQMVVTQQQSDDLRVILAAILQATNAEIEGVTGWTKWVPPEEGEP